MIGQSDIDKLKKETEIEVQKLEKELKIIKIETRIAKMKAKKAGIELELLRVNDEFYRGGKTSEVCFLKIV